MNVQVGNPIPHLYLGLSPLPSNSDHQDYFMFRIGDSKLNLHLPRLHPGKGCPTQPIPSGLIWRDFGDSGIRCLAPQGNYYIIPSSLVPAKYHWLFTPSRTEKYDLTMKTTHEGMRVFPQKSIYLSTMGNFGPFNLRV